MTNAEMIASLTAIHTPTDEGIVTEAGYIDWSSRDGDRRAFEVGGSDGDTAVLWMSMDDLREFHRRLTLTLLAESA